MRINALAQLLIKLKFVGIRFLGYYVAKGHCMLMRLFRFAGLWVLVLTIYFKQKKVKLLVTVWQKGKLWLKGWKWNYQLIWNQLGLGWK